VIKQQLQGELKNIPTDASQVCSSITLPLNKDESPSVVEKVLTCNNPEVNPPESNRVERKTYVFVLNVKGQPLMPTTPCKAKRLIKKGLAKVVKAYPFFVIQMLVQTRDCKQEVTLGIDSGYENIGFSAISSKKELISGTLVLDNFTMKRLSEKRMYRKVRRRMHCWYRKVRYFNRKKYSTRLPPSIQRRCNTHVTFINKLKTILPIDKTIIETANFDIQKIENPNIKGEQYKQGLRLGFENVKQYILSRDNRTCQHCGKTETRLEVHHIKFKSQGGTDRPNNLITLCQKCHKALHNGKFVIDIVNNKSFKSSSFMNIFKHRIKLAIPNMIETFGYITKTKRLNLGLEKTHYNDAFCIAGGYNQERVKPIELKQKHINNRILQRQRKGAKIAVRRQRYKIQPGDIIWTSKGKFTSKGCLDKGKYITSAKGLIRCKDVIKHFQVRSIY
jgi:hypothetical protein